MRSECKNGSICTLTKRKNSSCKDFCINTSDLSYDEAFMVFGLEGGQESRTLVPLFIKESSSMEGDLMEIIDLEGNPQEKMDFEDIFADFRLQNELGHASKLANDLSSIEEDLNRITGLLNGSEGMVMEESNDFDENFADFRHKNEFGPASKQVTNLSSIEEDLAGVLNGSEGKMREFEDTISVSAEAEECSDGNKSVSSVAGNTSSSSSSQSGACDWLNACSGDSAENRALRLVHLLSACAEAISDGAHDLAEVILARLREQVSPIGSTMERVAFYLSQSLLHCQESSGHLILSSQNPSKDLNFMEAFSLLNRVYPYIRFAHFIANQSILEAIPADQTHTLHILDFDIMEGMQWPPLMEALKTENHNIDHLKITAIKWSEDGSNPCCSQHTGRRLSDYACSLGIPFSFQEIQLGNLKKKIIFRKDETVMVNSMWGLPNMLERSRRKLSEFLDAAHYLNPTILTLGSGPHGIQSYQDLNFVEIFEQCTRNICAVFDSLEAGLAEQYGLARAAMENLFMGPLMCRPIHYSQNKQDLFFNVIDVPIKCGFIQGDLSEKNSVYAECMGNVARCYRVERLGQNQLLLRWQSTPLTSISVWKGTHRL